MLNRLELADPFGFKIAAAATSVASGAASWLASDWTLALFGAPLAAVLAGFAGAAAALTFMQPAPLPRRAASVLIGTLSASYSAPLVAHWRGWEAFLPAISFGIGLLAFAVLAALFPQIPKIIEQIRLGGRP